MQRESTGESSHRLQLWSSSAALKCSSQRGCDVPSWVHIKCHCFRTINSLTSFQRESNFRFLCFEWSGQMTRDQLLLKLCVKLLFSFTLSVTQKLWAFNYCNIKGRESSYSGLGCFSSYFSPFFSYANPDFTVSPRSVEYTRTTNQLLIAECFHWDFFRRVTDWSIFLIVLLVFKFKSQDFYLLVERLFGFRFFPLIFFLAK